MTTDASHCFGGLRKEDTCSISSIAFIAMAIVIEILVIFLVIILVVRKLVRYKTAYDQGMSLKLRIVYLIF